MGSKGVSVMVKGASYSYALWHHSSYFMSPSVRVSIHHKLFKFRNCSSTTTPSPLHPSDLSHFVKTTQISLTPNQVEDFAPKIQQVIGWFGQLQDVDLQSIEPSIRAETDNNLRDNAPETFEHRDAMIGAVPSYEDPYIKVPRVLSMD